MSILETICPLCGNPSQRGEVCGRCRAKETRWIECPDRIRIVICPTCGARREAGTWSDFTSSRDDLVEELTRRAVRLNENLKEIAIEVSITDISPNRSRAYYRVTGLLYAVPVEGSCTVEIEWKKEQCDRCSRISGSYYEGVVQIRAQGRRATEREISEAARIAHEVEDAMMTSGERLSFISDIEEHRDGLDITVGSQRLGQEIAAAITRELGGRFTTHPKLIGEKAGKQIFRITYSLRLPRYSRGDIVVVSGRYAEVLRIEAKTIRYLDLESGLPKSIAEQQVERRAGHKSEAKTWMVAYRDGDLLGILDPETGITRETVAPRWRDIPAGDSVRVIEDGEHLVVLG
ncbi:MAG: NMD3 family protein [Methanoregulaceae archaeon PtaU1.Bin222]|nr:MAG: NMD3 family protein [Methanoregulaceae archaeon PtaU1.Bin222]